MAETNEYREQRLASMRALKEMGYEPHQCLNQFMVAGHRQKD